MFNKQLQDSSGEIENEELSGFLKDLLELVKNVSIEKMKLNWADTIQHIGTFQDYDTSDLADFAETILKGCDMNKDGKVSKKVIGKCIVKTF